MKPKSQMILKFSFKRKTVRQDLQVPSMYVKYAWRRVNQLLILCKCAGIWESDPNISFSLMLQPKKGHALILQFI